MPDRSSGSLDRRLREVYEHIATFTDAKATMRDAHLDPDGVIKVTKTRSATLWGAISGQLDPRTAVGGEDVTVPVRASIAIQAVWVDSLTVGTFVERRADDPSLPIAGYDDLAAAARSIDDRTLYLNEQIDDVVGYNPKQLLPLLSRRIRPDLRASLEHPALGPLVALDGFTVGAEVVRRRRAGNLMGAI